MTFAMVDCGKLKVANTSLATSLQPSYRAEKYMEHCRKVSFREVSTEVINTIFKDAQNEVMAECIDAVMS